MDTECWTPFKLRFPSRREARLAVLDIEEREAAQRGGRRPKKSSRVIYECACGGYHIARRKPVVRPTGELVLTDEWLGAG